MTPNWQLNPDDTVIVHHEGVVSERATARLYRFADGNEWIPIKLIHGEDDHSIEIPEWLAKDRGLI